MTLSPQGISKILQTYFPFDCQLYIFNGNLKDNKKLPKWNHESKQGVYIGKYRRHLSRKLVVLNTKTYHITPQYHVIIYVDFTTIGEHRETLPEKWQDALSQNHFHINSKIDSLLQSIDWDNYTI